MERNVVSLETAKKLKAAGFPPVSMWHYSEGMDPSDELFFTQSSGSTQFDIPAPTAQEIADRLPGLWSVMNSTSRRTITPPTTAATATDKTRRPIPWPKS